MSFPKEMKALVFSKKGEASVQTIPVGELRPSYLLVKIEAVALNPTDWKSVKGLDPATPFSIVGCDCAGTVVKIGSEVTKSFKVGDSVFGVAHGSNGSQAYDGAFAEYAMLKGDVTMHSPQDADAGDLSTIPLCSITVGQGLFQPAKGLALEMPESGKGNGEWLFVYGGSTTAGCLGIQFATLAGYKVITACSPKNNELVKSRGAVEVFDYNDPECGAKIRKLTDNKLKYCWDTICKAKICNEALSSDSEGYRYACVLFDDAPFPRKEIQPKVTLMYTMFGEHFKKYGGDFPASVDDYEFAKKWTSLAEKLIAEGKIKPQPKRVGTGLEGILDGLEELKAGKVSGEKLVYRI